MRESLISMALSTLGRVWIAKEIPNLEQERGF